MQRTRAVVPPPSGQTTITSKHTRQDIQTAVAFLCMRVREPDTDDYKKNDKGNAIHKKYKRYNTHN